jgi:TP901 family phage tail tape measure protein
LLVVSDIAKLRGSVEIAGVARAQSQLKDLDQSMARTAAQAEKRSGGIASSFSKAGKALAVVGTVGVAGVAGLALGLGSAVRTAAGFQQSLADVGAATGATADEMKAMRQEALGIGRDTSLSASAAVTAMGELVKSGVAVGDVVGGVARTTAQLAEATGAPIEQMAVLLSDSMNVFRVGAAGASDAANILAKAAGASSISIGDMQQSMASGGLAASAAGMSVTDFATAVGIAGNMGLKAADAGTSLKSFLAGLTPQSKAAKQAFSELGIEVFDTAGNFRPFPDILASLSTAFGGLTSEQRAATAELLFGSDGIRMFNALVPETSKGLASATEQWDAFGTAMAATPDIAAQSAARLATASGALEQLKGSLETAAIMVGSALLPVLARLAGAATAGLGWLMDRDWSGVSAAVSGAFSAIGSAVSTLVTSIGGLASDVWDAIGPKVTAAASAIMTALGGVVAWVRDQWPAVRGAVVAGWDAVAGPVGAAATAITDALGSVATWVQENWSAVTDAIGTGWDTAKTAADTLSTDITTALGKVKTWVDDNWPAVGEALARAFENAKPVALAVLKELEDSSKNAADTIKEHWPSVRGVLERAFTDAKPVVTEVFDFFIGEAKRAKTQLEGESDHINTIWKNLIGKMRNNSESEGPGAFEPLKNALGQMASEMEPLWGIVQNTARIIWEGIKQTISGGVTHILGNLKLVTSFLAGDWPAAHAAAEQSISGLAQMAMGVLHPAMAALESVGHRAAGGIDAVRDAAANALRFVIDLAGTIQRLGDSLSRRFSLNIDWPSPPSWLSSLLPGSPPPLAVGIGMVGDAAQAAAPALGSMWAALAPDNQIAQFDQVAREVVSGTRAMTQEMAELGNAIGGRLGIDLEKVTFGYNTWLAVLERTGPILDAAAQATASYSTDQRALAASIAAANVQIAEWKMVAANLDPESGQAKAIGEITKRLEQSKAPWEANIALLNAHKAAAEASRTALDGFNDAWAKAQVSGIHTGQFGPAGPDLMSSAIAARDENTAAAGAALFADLAKFGEELRQAGVTNVVQVMEDINRQAWAALAITDPAARADALAAILTNMQFIWSQAEQFNTLSAATLGEAVAKAAEARAIAERAGGDVPKLFDLWATAAKEGGQKNIQALGDWIVGYRAKLDELPEYMRGKLGADLAAAWDDLAAGTEGAQDRFIAVGERIKDATAFWEKGFAKLPPAARQTADYLLFEVERGAIGLEEAQQRMEAVGAALKVDWSEWPPEFQSTMRQIVHDATTGAVGYEDAMARIDAATEAAKEAQKALAEAHEEATRRIQATMKERMAAEQAVTNQIAAAGKRSQKGHALDYLGEIARLYANRAPGMNIAPEFFSFQHGGVIAEPVRGIGLWSGRGYEIGEAGPERVTPVGQGGGQPVTIQLVLNSRVIAETIVPDINAIQGRGQRLLRAAMGGL